MFKAKKVQKRENVLNEFENNPYHTGSDLADKSDANEGALEPKITKKQKLNPDLSYTTKEKTQDYAKAANDYIDDVMFKARPGLVSKRDNATASNEVDTDISQDAKTIALRNMKLSKDLREGKLDKKYYHGMNVTSAMIEKTENEISSSKYTGSLGPIRASSNVRATCRFDYNPSLCKDWHDSGYCGFGDSCIYLHDRGDYKSGWEMEKEWDEEQKRKAKKFQITTSKILGDEDGDHEEEEEESDGLPTECPVCNKRFKNPVVTTCKHYYCEKCAFEQYKTVKKCVACNKPLNGIFNQANEIIEKLKGNGAKSKRPVIGHQTNERETREESEENEGLSGVDIEVADSKEREEEEGKDDLEELADEFKKEMAKGKEKFKSESDWVL